MSKHIGVLTSGGDCPGLNPAIRALVRAGNQGFGMRFTGFLNGFRGLVQDRTIKLEGSMLSGILTDGGTILGTSRDKPHKMPMGDKVLDMTDAIVETYRRHHLDALICIGGGGTQKNANRLRKAGLNILTLPKTIDNDIAYTDTSIGFNTAHEIATEAIDRLHSTATSHSRVIVVEIMGHRAGWLALESGVAGGADVILIPEIPYNFESVTNAIRNRARAGKRFSIVAVAEGAMSISTAEKIAELVKKKENANDDKDEKERISQALQNIHDSHVDHTVKLTQALEESTGQESRLTILGHLQRGGTPSAADRVLATRLGAEAAALLQQEKYGIMVAVNGYEMKPVALDEVAGNKKLVPPDHSLLNAARLTGTSFGD